METTTSIDRSADAPAASAAREPALPGLVDWVVPAVLAFVGAIFLTGGAALLAMADLEFLAEQVAAGTIQSDVFSTADLARIAFTTMWWSGVGLVITGIACWLGGVGYVVHRRRERRAADAPRSLWTAASVGGVTSMVLFFVPFSTALGGLVAGYLQPGDRDRTLGAGGLSGLLASLPAAAVLLFTFGGMATGAWGTGATAGLAFVVGVLVVSLLAVVLLGVIFGALGGYVGGRIAERRPAERAG